MEESETRAVGVVRRMAGQAVIGYVSLVYMNLFFSQTLKVDPSTSNLLVAGALTARGAVLYVCAARSQIALAANLKSY